MICSSLSGFCWSFDQLLDQLRVRYFVIKTVCKDELKLPKENVSLFRNSSEKRVKSPINGVGGAGRNQPWPHDLRMGPLAQRRGLTRQHVSRGIAMKWEPPTSILTLR